MAVTSLRYKGSALPAAAGLTKAGALSYNQMTMESPDPPWSDAESQPQMPAEPVPFAQAVLRAMAFFTRLPVEPAPADRLAACVMGFAPVGALIGLMVGVANLVARGLGLSNLLAALFAVAIGIVLTGALHEDGLADTADALGGKDIASRLAIMRDSRSGSYGVIALILSIGLRAVAIASLGGGAALFVLIGAHALSRGGLAAMLHALEPARRDGLGAAAGKPALDRTQMAVGLGAAILLVASLFASLPAGLPIPAPSRAGGGCATRRCPIPSSAATASSTSRPIAPTARCSSTRRRCCRARRRGTPPTCSAPS
jgi:adenosylcobinamide-GDP ribazoletransferase